jgi:hypothetical protein
VYKDEPENFKHTTIFHYTGKYVGVTILDEMPGFTGIYLRTAEGKLFPARTVDRSNKEHHESVVGAWMKHEIDGKGTIGVNLDLRKKEG